MKKVVFLSILLSIVLTSCGDTCVPAEVDEASIVTLEGEFIYMDDAAVLKGDTFIYGVTVDCMTEKLAEEVAPVKGDEFDMVPVVVKGVVNPKDENSDGWDEVATIIEIVSVSDAPSPADIRFEEQEETNE